MCGILDIMSFLLENGGNVKLDLFLALLPLLFWFVIFLLIVVGIVVFVVQISKRMSSLEQRVKHLEQKLNNRENA